MITVIILTIAVFIFTWIRVNGIIASIIISTIMAVFTFVPAAIIVHAISIGYMTQYKNEFTFSSMQIYEKNIRTLADNTNSLSGSFLLGSGGISSHSRYYFYIIDSDSSYYMSNISTNNCKIIESNTKKPCVVKYKKYIDWSKNELSNFLFKVKIENYYYHIYVPVNTIIVNYKLDA